MLGFLHQVAFYSGSHELCILIGRDSWRGQANADMQMLVDNGADVNGTSLGKVPLEWAIQSVLYYLGHVQITIKGSCTCYKTTRIYLPSAASFK
jgi:hypothetical protein